MKAIKVLVFTAFMIFSIKLYSQGTWAVAVLESGVINNSGLNEFTDPQAALGPKDGGYMVGGCCLGGGYIILDMGYLTPIVNNEGTDVKVYEIGQSGYGTGGDEPYWVFVRNSRNEQWESLGGGEGITEFDLSSTGLDTAQYIMIIDKTENPSEASSTPGADIDAVELINKPTSTKGTNSSQIPNDAILLQNYPNPFNPETNIEYSITKTSNVRIEIFNNVGQKIRDFRNEKQVPGHYKVHWDGKNEYGIQQATGSYYYRIQTEDYSYSKKMLLLK